jgi:nitroreductase
MSFSEEELEIVDRLLTTTRSVRRRLDLERPVPRSVVLDCVRIALQAPTASNLQTWRFVIVEDSETRAALGRIYRKTYVEQDAVMGYVDANRGQFERISSDQMASVLASARHLIAAIDRVPLLVLPCVETRLDEPVLKPLASSLYGSIFPAIWSLQLALRSRGLGSSVTTSHLWHAAEVADLLGIPDGVEQVALLPVAYFTGASFHPARRLPVTELVHWDRWDPTVIPPVPESDVAQARVTRAREEMSRLFEPAQPE